MISTTEEKKHRKKKTEKLYVLGVNEDNQWAQ